LDVETITNQVFRGKVALDRSVIRKEMDKNQNILDTIVSEPIQAANHDNAALTEESSLPQTNAVVAHVMDSLNSTNSGTISKREFKKAFLTFTDENQTEMDVEAITN
jgi:acetyl-CoA carboxylase alpha subunit